MQSVRGASVRCGGYTIVEVCVGLALGVLVMAGAFALVDSAQTVQKGVSAATRMQAKARDVFGALRDSVSMGEIDRIEIRDLPDGCQSIEFDYVVGHLLGLPVWGAYTRGVGEVVPASEVPGLGALGADYTAFTSWADSPAKIEELRKTYEVGTGYKERYFTTVAAHSKTGELERWLYRATINAMDQISCIEKIARLYPRDDAPGFQVRRSGDAIVFGCYLLSDSGTVDKTEFHVLPRN